MNGSPELQKMSLDQLDLFSLIGEIDTNSVTLIGQQQLSQIKSLQIQVESLKNQLMEREEELNYIKGSQNITIAIATITKIMRNMILSKDKMSPKNATRLQQIINEKDPIRKIEQFALFMSEYAQDNNGSIERLAAQLFDHIKLIEQITSGQYQTFLINSPKTLQKLMLGQAEKTKEFLSSFPEAKDSIIPSISDLIAAPFNPEKRYQDVCKFIRSNELQYNELKTLLLQEIAIVDSLRGFCVKTLQDQAESKASQENLRNAIQAEMKQQYDNILAAKEKELKDYYDNQLDEIQNQYDEQRSRDEQDHMSQVEDEVRAQLEEQLKPVVEKKVRSELTSQLTPYIEQEIREQLSSQIHEEEEQRYQEELEDEIRRKVENELYQTIREQLINELTEQLKQQLRPEIEDELRPEIEQQLSEQLTAKIGDDLRSQIYAELEQTFEEYYKSKISQVSKNIEDQLRAILHDEYQNQLNIKLIKERERISAEIEKSLRKNPSFIAEIEREIRKRDPPASKLSHETLNALSQAYDKLCEAIAIKSTTFNFNDFVSAILLTADILIEFRKHFNLKTGQILKPMIELEQQVQHLDQLHTQTRALLVRQSQIIANLRSKIEN